MKVKGQMSRSRLLKIENVEDASVSRVMDLYKSWYIHVSSYRGSIIVSGWQVTDVAYYTIDYKLVFIGDRLSFIEFLFDIRTHHKNKNGLSELLN